MNFSDFTYEELRRLTPRVVAVFLPLGCTEQQGPHITVDFDSRMITALCQAISALLEKEHGLITLVMPTLPFGPTPEHAGFGHGYVNLRQSTHEAIVEDALDSLAEQGFHHLLLWRGCGQHNLSRVVESFNAQHPSVKASQPVIDYGAISTRVLGDVAGGHADSFATSICLFLDQSRVRQDEIWKPQNQTFDWNENMDFAAISDTGVIGDPTHASRDAGEKLWDLCIEAGANLVLETLNGAQVRERWSFLPDSH